MRLRIRRIVITAMMTEVLAVISLIAVPTILTLWFGSVATLGSIEPSLQRHGRWVGPTSGFLLCFLGGWWVARGMESDQQRNGLAFGLLAAASDVGLLVFAGAPFAWVFVFSAVGRIAAGWTGSGLGRKAHLKSNKPRIA
jgi:hypothetical protein